MVEWITQSGAGTRTSSSCSFTWHNLVQPRRRNGLKSLRRYGPSRDWEPLTKDLWLIYTTVDKRAAEVALAAFEASAFATSS